MDMIKTSPLIYNEPVKLELAWCSPDWSLFSLSSWAVFPPAVTFRLIAIAYTLKTEAYLGYAPCNSEVVKYIPLELQGAYPRYGIHTSVFLTPRLGFSSFFLMCVVISRMEKAMGWCTAQWKMLLFCAKTSAYKTKMNAGRPRKVAILLLK